MEELNPLERSLLDEINSLAYLGLLDDAEAKWKPVPDHVKSSPFGDFTCLNLLARARRLNECLSEALRMKEKYPDQPGPQLFIIESLRQLKRPDESKAAAVSALNQFPNNPNFMMALANLEMEAGNLDRARELTENARAIAPDDVKENWTRLP